MAVSQPLQHPWELAKCVLCVVTAMAFKNADVVLPFWCRTFQPLADVAASGFGIGLALFFDIEFGDFLGIDVSHHHSHCGAS